MNLTIKKLLISLVLFGVAVVIALAAAGQYSNNQLVQSQARLTGIVLPLETANQKIRVAMAAFIERQAQIRNAESKAELGPLTKRTPLEGAFEGSLERLRALASDRAEAVPQIDQLTGIYNTFLNTDAAVFASMQTGLDLEARIDQLIDSLDSVSTVLQKDAQAIFNRINFAAMREKIALREYMATDEKTEELQAAVRDLLKGDLTRLQKACNDLRLAAANLTTHGRQILLAENKGRIEQIQETAIPEAAAAAQTALGVLADGVAESEELSALVQAIEKNLALLLEILQEIHDTRIRWIENQVHMAGLQAVMKQNTAAMTDSLEEIQALAGNLRAAAEDEAIRVRDFTRQFVWIAGLVSILFMILIGWIIGRRIIVPLDKAVAFAENISQGDLTAKIQLDRSELLTRFRLDRNDEIGNLVAKLSDMVYNLNALIGQVQKSCIQVSSSSTELAATSKQQESIISNQVTSTDYVIQSVAEISKVSGQLVETMQQVAAMSEETAEFAASGQTDLARMEEAIGHMEGASKSISGKLEAINEKASNITSVVTTITKVADQTNLLSLNAAIEAEKAGEYGRGFTVVAREIRRLADQTAVATLDIEQMVQDMQSAVSAGVMEMDAFIKEVQRSAEDVARISGQLTRIIEQVQSISPSFDNVNKSMQSQSERARKIDGAMVSLGDEMKQTMESLKESFLAIEQLNEAARGLQDEITRFKVA